MDARVQERILRIMTGIKEFGAGRTLVSRRNLTNTCVKNTVDAGSLPGNRADDCPLPPGIHIEFQEYNLLPCAAEQFAIPEGEGQ